MRARSIPVAVLAFLALVPAVCVGQEEPASLAITQRHQELTRWLAAYEAWERWHQRWTNRIAYNAAGAVVKKRPVRPEPPAWLPEECQAVIQADGALGRACAILDVWKRSDAVPFVASRVPRARTDVVPKSSFLQRVHLSGGWVPAQLPAPQVYLVAGMQVGIVEVGRATLPAVGVGLMAVADGGGGYDWKPATVIGIGYRITSFGFPWVRREANLHINVARATVHATSTLPLRLDPSQNLMGFSLTFARR